ncbi:hypothetical protein ACH41E_17595 [Streptomyces sp. NPDC020412]|uniref:hypothetical protein n=1 Tax=Streptomyces sp. NPDC020412 TaxID=3365073 RepID=UPI0037BBD422
MASADLKGLPPALARIVRECLRADLAARPAPAQVTTALVPGADSGVVHPPRLTPQARDLIAEHTTLAATQRLPTLGYTRHADTTTLPPSSVCRSQTGF